MEPPDLTPAEDTQLESLLRAQLAAPPLPDQGFTRSVLARLPRRRRTLPLLGRILGGLGAACTVTSCGWAAALALDTANYAGVAALVVALGSVVATWPLCRSVFRA